MSNAVSISEFPNDVSIEVKKDVKNNKRNSSEPKNNFKIERAQAPEIEVVPTSRFKGNVVFVLLCSVILAITLAAVLILNMSASSGQYRLAGMKNEQTALEQENQSLEQEVEYNNVPQNLAAKASALGMIPLDGGAYLNVGTGKIAGTEKPADSDTKMDQNVASPEVPYAAQASQGSSQGTTKGSASKDAGDSMPSTLTGGEVKAPSQKIASDQ